jgi:hypothetical protein
LKIVIPEADDAKTFGFEPACAHLISEPVCIGVVLCAVELDHQTRSHAGKVGDIGADRHLPTEMRTLGFDGAKPLP